MAGINLADQIKASKANTSVSSAPSNAKPFSMPSFKTEFQAEDRIRVFIMLFGLVSIFAAKYYVKDYTDRLTQQKEAEVSQLETSIIAERQKLNSLKDIAAEADTYNKRIEELRQKVNLVDSLSRNRNFLVRMLDFTVSEMPSPLWLRKIQVDISADGKIDLAGYATSLQLVGEYVKRLEGAVFFPSWSVVETESEQSTVLTSSSGKGIPIPPDSKRFSLTAKVVKQ
jgi:hypothetical protein